VSDAYDDALSYDSHSYTDHQPSDADQRASRANEQPHRPDSGLSYADEPLTHADEPPSYADCEPTSPNADPILSLGGHDDDDEIPQEDLAIDQPPQGPLPPSTLHTTGECGDVDGPFDIPMIWDERSFQDNEMSALGIIAHPELKILTCSTCKHVIDPDEIRKHVSRHLPRPAVDKIDYEKLREKFSLIPKKALTIPGSIIPAIPTLHVYRNLAHCTQCGYAVKNPRSLHRHTTCGEKVRYRLGYAQAYFPKENHGGFFAVTITEPPPNPQPGLNLLNLLKNKYPDPLPGQTPITLTEHVRDTNPFLARSNWARIFNGLTGQEVWNAVRADNDDLRGSVSPSVKRYIQDVNTKLGDSGCDNEGSAIGSYYGFV